MATCPKSLANLRTSNFREEVLSARGLQIWQETWVEKVMMVYLFSTVSALVSEMTVKFSPHFLFCFPFQCIVALISLFAL